MCFQLLQDLNLALEPMQRYRKASHDVITEPESTVRSAVASQDVWLPLGEFLCDFDAARSSLYLNTHGMGPHGARGGGASGANAAV